MQQYNKEFIIVDHNKIYEKNFLQQDSKSKILK